MKPMLTRERDAIKAAIRRGVERANREQRPYCVWSWQGYYHATAAAPTMEGAEVIAEITPG